MPISRRAVLRAAGVSAGAAVAASLPAACAKQPAQPPARASQIRYCLNTSTISGQKLGIVAEVELAAKTGYDGIEPWMRELDEYVKNGGSLDDLRKRIADLGLRVESAIGFAQWIVDDDAQRAKGLEQAKRDMDMLRQIGGRRIAAPPAGATQAPVDLRKAAERYRALLEVGQSLGVTPMVEVWGFSKSLSTLAESMFVALESKHPAACLLPDFYHLYKGGSDFSGLKLLSGLAVPVMHANDYPAEPRESITDAHRVFPGDGVCPLAAAIRDMLAAGFAGVFSLELFNREYWMRDAESVCRTGLEKMKAAVCEAAALS